MPPGHLFFFCLTDTGYKSRTTWRPGRATLCTCTIDGRGRTYQYRFVAGHVGRQDTADNLAGIAIRKLCDRSFVEEKFFT